MDWIATIFSVIGTFFIVKKHYYGQILYLVSNILWCVFAFNNNITSQLFLFTFYLLMSGIGAYQWYCDHKKVGVDNAV